jgi:UDP-N-acetylmuramyl pentapeptide phosphotransferase/UDP-N-acetylglucosamine-1-phosphate transferase
MIAATVAVVIGVLGGLAGASAMLARARRGGTPIDAPDERRLHQRPTPRGGGVGIAFATFATTPLAMHDGDSRTVALIVAWASLNGLIGIVDDYRPIRQRYKLVAQLAGAVLVVAAGLRLDVLVVPPLGNLDLGAAGVVFSVLWLVWLANVFNFMDGMDALAAGCGILMFATLAALGYAAGGAGPAIFLVTIAGGLAGFLPFNLPPARIFMGDGASLFCGAALGGAALAIARTGGERSSITAAALVAGPFVWDATFTFVRRVLRGEPIRSHRTHLFQRLAVAGWTHARVRGIYLAATLLGAAAAIASAWGETTLQATALAVALVAAVALAATARQVERQRT